MLLACNTGATTSDGRDNFAQQLADEMGEGESVIAPNGFLAIDSKTFTPKIFARDKNNPNQPDINIEGRMITFTGRPEVSLPLQVPKE
ncbi:MAG: hypothetical protein Ta2B_10670 [Termitinemataceae bacterium]|nr:MAG: hypothetical protein Ta2B_10670 [Termitinemataceae bacterium]